MFLLLGVRYLGCARRNPKQNCNCYLASRGDHLRQIKFICLGCKMIRTNGARCWPLLTQPLGILLARRAHVQLGVSGVWRRRRGTRSGWLLICCFAFPAFHLERSPSLSRELRVCFGGLNVHATQGHPLPKELANSKASFKLHFFIQDPLIISALVIFCCHSFFCEFVLPRMME